MEINISEIDQIFGTNNGDILVNKVILAIHHFHKCNKFIISSLHPTYILNYDKHNKF